MHAGKLQLQFIHGTDEFIASYIALPAAMGEWGRVFGLRLRGAGRLLVCMVGGPC